MRELWGTHPSRCTREGQDPDRGGATAAATLLSHGVQAQFGQIFCFSSEDGKPYLSMKFLNFEMETTF